MLFNKQFLLASAAVLATFLNNVKAQKENVAIAPEDSDVVKLGTETFDSFIQENSLVLAEFFAPWCGHCKTLAPEYVAAASILKAENDIPLAQIDCTENQDLCMSMGIKGYPTLKVIRNGDSENAADYTGGRNKNEIVSFMQKQNLPSVSVFEDVESLKTFISEQKSNDAIIINHNVLNSELNETFYKIAEYLRDDYIFAATNNKADKLNKVSIKLPNQKEEIEFDLDSHKDNNSTELMNYLGEWITVESKPYFGEIDASSYEPYMLAEVPLAYFFYTSAAERAKYQPFFEKLGKEYRGKINFAGLDASKFGKHAENLNMKEQFPFFAIHDIVESKKYGTEQVSDEVFEISKKANALSEKDIAKFIKQFVAGELEPIVKSEEIPSTQETNVTRIVGKNHDDIRYDETKDVLVKYYAPWCGHCKKLAPIFENLADIYASSKEGAAQVVIGDIDATLNDVFDVEIQGFPTIVLYPAGSDKTPVVYSGPRSVESFIKFINENGNSTVDAFEILERQAAAAEEAEDEANDELEHDEL